jgi:guanylate kinase
MWNKVSFRRTGILFVISAPSGGGKTTLCGALRQKQEFVYSVSCTTRQPRPGERDGEDYHFISREVFEEKALADEFLEHAEVHGNFYGTLKQPILDHLARGEDVLLDIDIAGAESIRACTEPVIQNALTDIFLMPPGLDELRFRLEKRGTESPEEIQIRLHNASTEMSHWNHYRYLIVSRSIEENLASFRAIVDAERCRTRRYSLES